MEELLWKYLIGPIVADSQNAEELVWQGVTAYPGYNPVNTVTYLAIALSLLYLAYRFFEAKEVEINSELALHSIPFMFLGGALRFLEDAQVVSSPNNILLITPIIYILIALVYIPAVTYLEKRQIAYLGTGLLIPTLLIGMTQLQQFDIVYGFLAIGVSAVLTFLYSSISTGEYGSRPMVAVAGSQLFEGTASMLASFYGYNPKQLLAQYFNSFLGPPGILAMKIGILALAISIVTDIEEERLKGITFLVLYAIGFGTGFRVFLRVLAGI